MDPVFKCLFCELEGDYAVTQWYKIKGTDQYLCEDCRRKLFHAFPPQDVDKITFKIKGSGKFVHKDTRFNEIMTYIHDEGNK